MRINIYIHEDNVMTELKATSLEEAREALKRFEIEELGQDHDCGTPQGDGCAVCTKRQNLIESLT